MHQKSVAAECVTVANMSRNSRRAGPTLALEGDLLDALARVVGGDLLEPKIRDRIVRGVLRLNAGLTRERESFGGYLADDDLLAAYRTYYLCANVPKLWPLLDAAARSAPWPQTPRILDVGSGPGTGLVAFELYARRHGLDGATGLSTDNVPLASAAASQLFQALGMKGVSTARLDWSKPDVLVPGGPFDAVVCMNVVNELDQSNDRNLIANLRRVMAPGARLLVVEPASKVESRRVLAFRDLCVDVGLHVAWPCTHASTCGALRDVEDWCHGEWRFERPEFMREVDRRTGLLREVLKATVFVAHEPGPELGEVAAPTVRVVGRRTDEKGRSRVTVCGASGLETLELQKRDRSASNQDLFDLSRFDLVRVSPAASGLSAGAIRLGPDDLCERLPEE